MEALDATHSGPQVPVHSVRDIDIPTQAGAVVLKARAYYPLPPQQQPMPGTGNWRVLHFGFGS
jgi:hypothetical protein